MRQTTAREAMVNEYRPLVRRIAHSLKRRVSHRAEMDDLMQAGMEGLLKAAPRFNPESGASFNTFVGHRIKGAMYDAVRKTSWVPRAVNRAARDIASAIRAIEVAEQRPARETEIAAHLGLALPEYRELLHAATSHHIFSMEEAPEAVNTAAHSDPWREVARAERDERVRAAIANLPERERYIIEQTYIEGSTLLDVGKELGITESRTCQLRNQGVARLRAKFKN